MAEVEALYRYCDHLTLDGVQVGLETYYVVKRTLKGYWIGHIVGDFYHFGEKKRWVSDYSVKRFAYPTKEEAATSFIARKRRQIGILRHQLNGAEDALIKGMEILAKVRGESDNDPEGNS